MKRCAGCAERHEKMVAAFNTFVEWIKQPHGEPPTEIMREVTEQTKKKNPE